MFGLFVEHGPFSVTKNLTLKKRDEAWTFNNNVIYVDQPVGTGKEHDDDASFPMYLVLFCI